MDGVRPVGVEAAAGPAPQNLAQQVPAPVLVDAVDAPVADRLLVGRHPAADGLGQAAGEHSQQPQDQEGAGVGGRRELRSHQRAFGREAQLQQVADAFVDVQLGRPLGRGGEVAQDASHPLAEEEAVRVVARVVDRPARLGTGPGQVADDPLGRLGHGHPERVQPGRLDAVVLDIVLEDIGPVRDPRQDLGPEGVGAAPDQRFEAGLHRLNSVALEQLHKASGAHLAGRDLGVQVARERLRRARVADDHAIEVLVPPAGFEEADRRDHQSFLEGRGRVRRHRAGDHPPDVVVVAESLDEGHHAAVVEHRHGGGEVGQVADRAFREIDVVVVVDVAVAHALEREVADHRLDHGRVGAAGELPALSVVDPGPVVVLVADHRRAGGAFDRRFHLGLDRVQRAFHDLEHDRIHSYRFRSSHDGARGCRAGRPRSRSLPRRRSWSRIPRRSPALGP